MCRTQITSGRRDLNFPRSTVRPRLLWGRHPRATPALLCQEPSSPPPPARVAATASAAALSASAAAAAAHLWPSSEPPPRSTLARWRQPAVATAAATHGRRRWCGSPRHGLARVFNVSRGHPLWLAAGAWWEMGGKGEAGGWGGWVRGTTPPSLAGTCVSANGQGCPWVRRRLLARMATRLTCSPLPGRRPPRSCFLFFVLVSFFVSVALLLLVRRSVLAVPPRSGAHGALPPRMTRPSPPHR